MEKNKGILSSWEADRKKFAEVGQELLSFLDPKNPQSAKTLIEYGVTDEELQRNPEEYKLWREAIKRPEDWINDSIQLLSQRQIDHKSLDKALVQFMERLTGAEAILEDQYYYVGIALLRAEANDKLPTKSFDMIQSDLANIDSSKK